jgi:hypothetical protein
MSIYRPPWSRFVVSLSRNRRFVLFLSMSVDLSSTCVSFCRQSVAKPSICRFSVCFSAVEPFFDSMVRCLGYVSVVSLLRDGRVTLYQSRDCCVTVMYLVSQLCTFASRLRIPVPDLSPFEPLCDPVAPLRPLSGPIRVLLSDFGPLSDPLRPFATPKPNLQ